MKNYKLLIASLALVAFGAHAQRTVSVTTDGDNPRTVSVTALNGNILKVTNAPAGVSAPQSRTTVAVKYSADDARAITDYQRPTIVTSGGVTATIDNASGAVSINAGPGRMISDNGCRPSADGATSLSLATTGRQSFYGGGERGHAYNFVGDTLKMYNRATYGYGKGDPRASQMNITMPLLISSNGYALLFDDYATAKMVVSNPIEYISETDEPINYYFINGATSMADVIKNLSELTGRQPLPPLWAMGYITSRYGYRTEKEALGAVDTLQRAGYPLDGIVLDLYWFGREQDMGRLDWDTKAFPTYKDMLAKLKKKNVNTVIISEPFVLTNGLGIDNYNDLSARRYFVNDSTGNTGTVTIWVGQGGMFDVSNPGTRQWLSDRYHSLTDDGVIGWWGDLGEPEAHPDSLVHFNGKTARRYHNIYGNDWASIISEMYAKEYPNRRLMTLMRAGTVGLQRYNVFPWSGDVARTWQGLQAQMPIMLNAGLSGLGYMSHDVGGFAIDPSHPKNPEMYVRWLQVGLFTPTLRTHAPFYAEPYNYPEQQDIILPLIKERYAWLPYNYTLAYDNSANGMPLVRPIGFYDADASLTDTVDDQYLWGRDIMVAPVLTPDTSSRRVVIPSGKWLDMANPANIYNGGDTVTYATPLSVLPLFVRAGAFIPRADYKMNSTVDYKTSAYTVRYYPVEGKSDGLIYEDDLTTPTTLAEGRYQLIRFEGDATADAITIDIAAEKGSADYTPSQTKKAISLEVYNVDTKPANVTIDNRKANFKYDAKNKRLTIALAWNSVTPSKVVIKR